VRQLEIGTGQVGNSMPAPMSAHAIFKITSSRWTTQISRGVHLEL
jgi:hypothetical protein